MISRLAAALAASERRRFERRSVPTPMMSRYSLNGGRRIDQRRSDDDPATFVDLYGARLFVVVLSILGLNLLDAWFTLLFLSHGGRELNPLVQEVLDLGPVVFIAFKTLGIGVCVGFLTLTKNFRAARIGLGIVLVGYTLLLVWHLFLCTQIEAR